MREMVAAFHFENNEAVKYLSDLHLNPPSGLKVTCIIEDKVIEKYELLNELLNNETINFLLYLKNNSPNNFERISGRFNKLVIEKLLR